MSKEFFTRTILSNKDPNKPWESASMEETTIQRECGDKGVQSGIQKSEIKCVTIMLFEEKGKTIFQPLVTGKDAQRIQELFNNETLEVWLPNGASDPAEFDVGILKYKQQIQPTKKCILKGDLVCLKNHFKTIVSCEQCPASTYETHNRW